MNRAAVIAMQQKGDCACVIALPQDQLESGHYLPFESTYPARPCARSNAIIQFSNSGYFVNEPISAKFGWT